MVESWINPQNVKQQMSRNGIFLTDNDANNILSQVDQVAAYNKARPRVTLNIWDGKPLNGVDPRNHPGGRVTLDPHTQNIINQINMKLKALGQERVELPETWLPTAARHTSHQFLTRDQGLAYTVSVDGKLNGFQPHVPGVPGWHALTSKTATCNKCGKHHDVCPTCKQEHDIITIMNKQADDIAKNLASSEIMTKLLYLAQEIHSRRMAVLDKLANT